MKRLFNIAQENLICQKYINKISPNRLAEEYKCHYSTIYNILKRHNIVRLGHIFLDESYIDRFYRKYIILKNGCWQWKNWKNKVRPYPSFGYVNSNGKAVNVAAHRFSYELKYGKIPNGKHVHHLCHNKSCVNPDHLSLVTRNQHPLLDNTITGINKRKTHCPQGHPYNKENTYVTKKGFRHCRICKRIREEKLHIKKYGKPIRHRGEQRKFCKNGHKMTQENTYINPSEKHICRTCARIRGRRYDRTKRPKRIRNKPTHHTKPPECNLNHANKKVLDH